MSLSGLVDRLGLSDEEALVIFDLDALGAISGDVGHRPEVEILDELTREAAEACGGAAMLARWVRAGTGEGRPIELLLRGDFAGFEDALAARVAEVRG
ncbi:MAG TPA: hypothetical protein VKS25_06240 [Solirubrobacteraceae bacterium]|nr:hypothetical protein [Solirubrobacteraceae bacterium]